MPGANVARPFSPETTVVQNATNRSIGANKSCEKELTLEDAQRKGALSPLHMDAAYAS
jgi:hypothetical protein